MTIRLATVDDIEAIIRLRLHLLDEMGDHGAVSDEDMAEILRVYLPPAMLTGRCLIWLARAGGIAVACGAANVYERIPHRSNITGQEWLISNMYTLPAHRSQGLAKGIVRAMQAEARERCVHRMWLEASPDGRALYEASGFVEMHGAMEWTGLPT